MKQTYYAIIVRNEVAQKHSLHGGYIGESTAKEIDYARGLGKVVRWLE